MKDTFGNPLAVGDIVAYSHGKSSRLFHYVVLKLGAKKIKIDQFDIKDGIIAPRSETRSWITFSFVYPERVAKKNRIN